MQACSEVVDGGGETAGSEWIDGARHRHRRRGRGASAGGLFLLLGAEPHCDWLPPTRSPATSAASC